MIAVIAAAIWWTGVCVLSAGALLGAAALIAAVSIAAVALGTYYIRRLGVLPANLRSVRQWVHAGKPVWKNVSATGGHEMQMVPTAPRVEFEEDGAS